MIITITAQRGDGEESQSAFENSEELIMNKSGKIFIENGDFKNIDNNDGDSKFKSYGYRHQQTLVMFLCLSTAYSMRACMGVAMVGMIDDSVKASTEVTSNITKLNATLLNINDTCISYNDTTTLFVYDKTNETDVELNKLKENNKGINVTESKKFKSNGVFNALLFTSPFPKFYWTKKIQDTIQSSFFWGYMILQIPGGQLVHMFGARRLLTSALGINSFVSLMFPWISYYGGWICAIICRLVQGLSQACIIPGIHSFFGKWAPLEERARLVGFAQGGQALGTVIGLPITAFIAASSMGWPGIFRFYGILSGLFAFIVYYFIADTPAQHPKISASEKRYIEDGLGMKEGAKKHPIPWAKIFRSRAVYAMIFAHIGQTWGQVTLFTEVPSFMANVMQVDIKTNGLLTALPFLVMWFTSFFFNWFTDMIIVKKYLNVTNARKLANFIGCVPPSIGLVILAFAPKNIYVVESLLIFICAFKISSHVGFIVNHIDLTPNFAGTTMSLSNFVTHCVGSQAPMVAGFILTDVKSEQQWRYVFLVAAALYFMSNLVYMILGSAEKADWNDSPSNVNEATEMVRQETQPMIENPDQDKL